MNYWLKTRLLETLQRDHKGRNRAIHIDSLLAKLKAWRPLEKLTREELRVAKEELIEERHLICSGQRGWWYGASLNEAEEGALAYDGMEKDARNKARCLRAAGEALYGNQMELPA